MHPTGCYARTANRWELSSYAYGHSSGVGQTAARAHSEGYGRYSKWNHNVCWTLLVEEYTFPQKQ